MTPTSDRLHPQKFRPKQIVEALKSPQYWLLVVFAVAQAITNAGITNFNPLIINGFGFSKVRTTVGTMPPRFDVESTR